MKKITIVTFLCFAVQTILAQNFVSLEIETLRCSNHKWQEVEYLVDGTWLPSPKLSGTSSADYTVTGSIGSIELYRPFDGDPDTHAWLGYIEPPQESKSIILTFHNQTVNPDSIRFIKPSYSAVSDFRIWGITEGADAERILLLDVIDLASQGYVEMAFPLKVVTDTLSPSKPANLSVTGMTPTSIAFTWDPSTDDRNTIFYQVIVDDLPVDTSHATAYLLGNLSPDITYEIKVAAFDESGNISMTSDSMLVTTPFPDTELPSAPSSLVLDSATCEVLYFSWTAATDNEGVAGYPVILNGNIAGVATQTSFALPGLDEDSEYTVRVLARDASGNLSSGFAEASFRTTPETSKRMKIGTGFWDIGWGGAENDPFVSGYSSFVVSENPWKAAFLEETSFYSNYRFMDYNNTNNSKVSHWRHRTQREDPHQNPVAYEWMIDLCNRQGADLWVTVPHYVVSRNGMEGNDNHYMKKLAILVKTGIDMMEADLDKAEFEDLSYLTEAELLALGGVKTCEPLNPNLQFYIEYSNETWNHSFDQATYCDQEGQALGLTGDFYAQGRQFHAWAAIHLFEATDEVFGPGNPRIMRIDAYQAVVPAQIRDHFGIYKSDTHNPTGILPDAFSPAPYFGYGVDGSDVDAVSQLISGSSGILERTKDLKNARQIMQQEIDNGYPVKRLVAYEAGQHILTNAHVMSTDPSIYTLYVRYLDSCSAYLDELTHYVHCGTFGSGGAWGSKAFIGQDPEEAHKYRALLDWHNDVEVRPDLEPPSVPDGLTYSELDANGYTLHWNPSLDNHGVKDYTVMVGESLYAEVSDTLLKVSGLLPGRTYSNKVLAVDSTGNSSAFSEEINVTTEGEASFTVTFRVKNSADDSPVESAQVALGSNEVQTDANGEAIFEDLAGGTGISYSVVHTSFTEVTGTVGLLDGDSIIEVALQPLTGIRELSVHWKMYPNPCQEYIHIDIQDVADLSFRDLSGKILIQVNEYRGGTISTGSLAPGVYVAELEIDGMIKRRLLIKR